jgi:hypothetical protein
MKSPKHNMHVADAQIGQIVLVRAFGYRPLRRIANTPRGNPRFRPVDGQSGWVRPPRNYRCELLTEAEAEEIIRAARAEQDAKDREIEARLAADAQVRAERHRAWRHALRARGFSSAQIKHMLMNHDRPVEGGVQLASGTRDYGFHTPASFAALLEEARALGMHPRDLDRCKQAGLPY